MEVIRTKSLTKTYNGKGGISDVTLSVEEGIVYGFLGPNGSGKSTFVRTLLGLLQPVSGEGYILGEPIGTTRSREQVGYLPELFRYPDWLTGRQLLEQHAKLCKMPVRERKRRIDEVIEWVGMTGRENEKIKGFSKGMSQRIGLACAILNDPKVIFLDEPTSALDPIGRKEVRDLLIYLRSQGKTIFLNSHLLYEVESVCDHIAIVHNGEMVVEGAWRELINPEQRVELVTSQIEDFRGHNAVKEYQKLEQRQDRVRWSVRLGHESELPAFIHELSEKHVSIYEVKPVIPHLEDVFLHWVYKKKEKDYVDDQPINH